MQESFHWSDAFLTGLPEVDAQHQELVALLNRFSDSLTDINGDESNLDSIFAELAEYAQYHFTSEEALMDSVGIDPRHGDRQRQQHRDFLASVVTMRTGGSGDAGDARRDTLKFIVRWLANHILGTDQILGRQIVAIRAGMSPAAAFTLTEEGKTDLGRSTEPLVDALGGLYQEVAERNRVLITLNQSLEEKVAERTAELVRANQQLEAMAMTDPLTGLPNRRHAMVALERMWDEATRTKKPLSCMLIDADGFKKVNDTWGHDAGDIVLRELSRTLRDAVRSDDLVCRLGGDEFFILCPNTPLNGIEGVAKALRLAVSLRTVQVGDREWPARVSVGYAERRPTMSSYEALIKAADDGLYRAKDRGRNCVASMQRD